MKNWSLHKRLVVAVVFLYAVYAGALFVDLNTAMEMSPTGYATAFTPSGNSYALGIEGPFRNTVLVGVPTKFTLSATKQAQPGITFLDYNFGQSWGNAGTGPVCDAARCLYTSPAYTFSVPGEYRVTYAVAYQDPVRDHPSQNVNVVRLQPETSSPVQVGTPVRFVLQVPQSRKASITFVDFNFLGTASGWGNRAPAPVCSNNICTYTSRPFVYTQAGNVRVTVAINYNIGVRDHPSIPVRVDPAAGLQGAQAHLVITGITGSFSSPTTGSISISVKNQGTIPSPTQWNLEYFVYNADTHAIGPTYSSGQKTANGVGVINPGETKQVVIPITHQFTPGQYKAGAFFSNVPSGLLVGGRFDTPTSFTVPAAGLQSTAPDLTFDGATSTLVSSTYAVGTTGTVRTVLKNIGQGGTSTVKGRVGTGGVGVGYATLYGPDCTLSGGMGPLSETQPIDCTYPVPITIGSYDVWVEVDHANQYVESNENNNKRKVGTITVTLPVSAALSIVPQSDGIVRYQITNKPAGALSVQYKFNDGQWLTPTVSPNLEASNAIFALALPPRSEQPVTYTVTVQFSIAGRQFDAQIPYTVPAAAPPRLRVVPSVTLSPVAFTNNVPTFSWRYEGFTLGNTGQCRLVIVPLNGQEGVIGGHYNGGLIAKQCTGVTSLTLTADESQKLLAGRQYYWYIDSSDDLGNGYLSAIGSFTMGSSGRSSGGVTAGLVAYYPFDDHSLDYASAAGTYDGDRKVTVAGGSLAQYTPSGKKRSALDLANRAVRDWVHNYVAPKVPIDLGQTWAVQTWFKAEALRDSARWRTLTRGTNDHQTLIGPPGQSLLGAYGNGRRNPTDGFQKCVPNYDMSRLSDGWHNLAVVQENNGITYYIDGVQACRIDGWTSTTDIVAIGNYQGGGQVWAPLDEFRVYNRALTAQEVVQNCQADGGCAGLSLQGTTLPNLIIRNLRVSPERPIPDQPFSLSYDVVNTGGQDISGSFYVKGCLGTDCLAAYSVPYTVGARLFSDSAPFPTLRSQGANSYTYRRDAIFLGAGTYTFSITADAVPGTLVYSSSTQRQYTPNMITEVSEVDNVATLTFSVQESGGGLQSNPTSAGTPSATLASDGSRRVDIVWSGVSWTPALPAQVWYRLLRCNQAGNSCREGMSDISDSSLTVPNYQYPGTGGIVGTSSSDSQGLVGSPSPGTYTYRVVPVNAQGRSIGVASAASSSVTIPAAGGGSQSSSPRLYAFENNHQDTGGSSQHGTFFGQSVNGQTIPGFISGKKGLAISLSNSPLETRYVELPDFPITNALTIEAWVNTNSTQTWQAIAERGSPSNVGWHVYLNGGNRLYSNLGVQLYSPANSIPQRAWKHLAVTWDGSTVKHYIDGQEVASTRMTPSQFRLDGNKVYVGIRRAAGDGLSGPHFGFNGYLDEVRMYSRALSRDDILKNCQADGGCAGGGLQSAPQSLTLKFAEGSGPTARSVEGQQCSVSGAAWGRGYSGDGLSFDGVDDFVLCPNGQAPQPTTDFVAQAWINPSGTQPGLGTIVAGRGSSFLFALSQNNKLTLYLDNDGIWRRNPDNFWGIASAVQGNTVLTPGRWYHVGVTYSTQTRKVTFYVDGRADGEVTVSQNLPIFATDQGISIGAAYPSSPTAYRFRGQMDQVYIGKIATLNCDVEGGCASQQSSTILPDPGHPPATGPVPACTADDWKCVKYCDASGNKKYSHCQRAFPGRTCSNDQAVRPDRAGAPTQVCGSSDYASGSQVCVEFDYIGIPGSLEPVGFEWCALQGLGGTQIFNRCHLPSVIKKPLRGVVPSIDSLIPSQMVLFDWHNSEYISFNNFKGNVGGNGAGFCVPVSASATLPTDRDIVPAKKPTLICASGGYCMPRAPGCGDGIPFSSVQTVGLVNIAPEHNDPCASGGCKQCYPTGRGSAPSCLAPEDPAKPGERMNHQGRTGYLDGSCFVSQRHPRVAPPANPLITITHKPTSAIAGQAISFTLANVPNVDVPSREIRVFVNRDNFVSQPVSRLAATSGTYSLPNTIVQGQPTSLTFQLYDRVGDQARSAPVTVDLPGDSSTAGNVYGTGRDGALGAASFSVAGKQVNSYAVVSSASGATVTLADASSFTMGDLVLVMQMQGSADNVGKYEFKTVTAKNGNTLTMNSPLTNTYSNAGNSRAQAIRVPQYTTVEVPAGKGIIAAPWNGQTGGVVAFKASGAVKVYGGVNAAAKGFRGGTSSQSGCLEIQGESVSGLGSASDQPNAGAGGGGQQENCPNGAYWSSGAGGGGYGTAGGAGARGIDGTPADEKFGVGGLPYGSADLASRIYLGSGGGAGGSWHQEPAGGAGGGIVMIYAQSIEGSGLVTAEGGAAAGGEAGGSGGGSGGSILLRTNTNTIPAANFIISGGVEGSRTGFGSGNRGSGGRGGAGRYSAG